MSASPNDFNNKQRVAREKYISCLPDKISEIKSIWQQLITAEWRFEILLKMQSLVHNLLRSSDTFGLLKLSSQANSLEAALEELKITHIAPSDPSKIATINELLLSLEAIELTIGEKYTKKVVLLANEKPIILIKPDNDILTGLLLPEKMNEYLDLQINICERYNHVLSYAIIEIDNLTNVNDLYGEQEADKVIIMLAKLLQNNIRASDFAGRYGREGFVLILPETDELSALSTLDRIRSEFAELAHYAGDKIFYVTFSAGISSFPNFGDVDTIMGVASKALFYSQKHGKNRITIWDKNINGAS